MHNAMMIVPHGVWRKWNVLLVWPQIVNWERSPLNTSHLKLALGIIKVKEECRGYPFDHQQDGNAA
jgi:hypothetical protein